MASNSAFMKKVNISDALIAIVGPGPLPRTDITKNLWVYIKKNGLQDPNKKQMINADEKLKIVFKGQTQVSMFQMTKLVNEHILKE